MSTDKLTFWNVKWTDDANNPENWLNFILPPLIGTPNFIEVPYPVIDMEHRLPRSVILDLDDNNVVVQYLVKLSREQLTFYPGNRLILEYCEARRLGLKQEDIRNNFMEYGLTIIAHQKLVKTAAETGRIINFLPISFENIITGKTRSLFDEGTKKLIEFNERRKLQGNDQLANVVDSTKPLTISNEDPDTILPPPKKSMFGSILNQTKEFLGLKKAQNREENQSFFENKEETPLLENKEEVLALDELSLINDSMNLVDGKTEEEKSNISIQQVQNGPIGAPIPNANQAQEKVRLRPINVPVYSQKNKQYSNQTGSSSSIREGSSTYAMSIDDPSDVFTTGIYKKSDYICSKHIYPEGAFSAVPVITKVRKTTDVSEKMSRRPKRQNRRIARSAAFMGRSRAYVASPQELKNSSTDEKLLMCMDNFNMFAKGLSEKKDVTLINGDIIPYKALTALAGTVISGIAKLSGTVASTAISGAIQTASSVYSGAVAARFIPSISRAALAGAIKAQGKAQKAGQETYLGNIGNFVLSQSTAYLPPEFDAIAQRFATGVYDWAKYLIRNEELIEQLQDYGLPRNLAEDIVDKPILSTGGASMVSSVISGAVGIAASFLGAPVYVATAGASLSGAAINAIFTKSPADIKYYYEKSQDSWGTTKASIQQSNIYNYFLDLKNAMMSDVSAEVQKKSTDEILSTIRTHITENKALRVANSLITVNCLKALEGSIFNNYDDNTVRQGCSPIELRTLDDYFEGYSDSLASHTMLAVKAKLLSPVSATPAPEKENPPAAIPGEERLQNFL